ncbi:hypothetical protein KFE96_09515 [Kordiimonas sp. SCSIO 12603]|uniref:HAMP domain-containing sensor histidine kinase n=1 Tax=Kordiimonas sp. SCSIO 12603 TaxID=2829596 RepID=UPI0021034805|nr:histidine kinase [Kordiimonas sp. SCSIO 12603]UTW57104.1 hypothetical protein KFE96_09515 [Kordiimonas sp. SCSIO 12603]
MFRVQNINKARSKLWWRMARNSVLAFVFVFFVINLGTFMVTNYHDHHTALQHHHLQKWVTEEALPHLAHAMETGQPLSEEAINTAASTFDHYHTRVPWSKDPLGFYFNKARSGRVYTKLTITNYIQDKSTTAFWPREVEELNKKNHIYYRSFTLPVITEQGEEIGSAQYQIYAPFEFLRALQCGLTFPYYLWELLFSAIFAGVISALLTASGYSSRLSEIVKVTDRWSAGDFSKRIQEKGSDEITDHMKRLNEMAEELQEIVQLRQLISARNERDFFASELHDTVKQNVFGLSMQLGALKANQNLPNEVSVQIEEASKTVEEINKEIVTLLNNLKTDASATSNLAETLESITAKFREEKDLSIRLQATTVKVSENEAHHIKRIVQESLNNIWKHASATDTEITLALKGNRWVLSICDDGKGFDETNIKPNQFGLTNLKERASKIGAEVAIITGTGKGTCIEISWRATANNGQTYGTR